jgi:lipopolysaccharide export system ATP-binding protein
MTIKTLRTGNLVKAYQKKRVVDDLSLEVKTGQIVGLLGPNGAGKTTTFYMIVGLVKPDVGRVWLGDEDITSLPMYHRARKGIGYLPQETSVFRKLTVEENILAILEVTEPIPRLRRKRLNSLLEELNISHLARRKAYTLSGGERRRVEISRTLVTNPSFILLDEPFTGVDPITLADIQQIIRQLKAKNIGVLITDHRVRETLAITDRAYIIYEGMVLISGTSQELATNEEARKIYLGERFTLAP